MRVYKIEQDKAKYEQSEPITDYNMNRFMYAIQMYSNGKLDREQFKRLWETIQSQEID